MVFACTPCPINRVAAVCLKPWKGIRGNPFLLRNSGNHPLIVSGCIGLPSHVVNNLSDPCHRSPISNRSFACSDLYFFNSDITDSGTETTLFEVSVFGSFVITPMPGTYWLVRFTSKVLFLKLISLHSSPISSPRLKPVDMASITITLYLSGSFSNALNRSAVCCSL